MISSRIKKMDATSIELKVKYRPKLKGKVNIRKYAVETYIFLPVELGINKRNFTNIDFYREYKNHLKIDPPKVLLSEIADRSHKFMLNYNSIVENFDINNMDSIEMLDDNTKILLNVYKKAIKREVQKIIKYSKADEKIRVAKRLIKNIDISINNYRKRQNSILAITTDECKINKTISIGNEYISNLKYRFFHEAILFLMNDGDTAYYSVIQELKQSLELEIEYRKEHNYPLSSTVKKENETLIKRWNVIKYFISNKLIIKAKIDKDSKYLEEILYSFAAGIAMIFATSIAFYYNKKFGNFTLSFFVVLVLSYMFKDRIKEWARSFFSSILQKQLLDHHYNLYDDNSVKIGNSKDGFEFIPQTSLSQTIKNIRYSDELLATELMNHEEKVMKFTRKININMRQFIKTFGRIDLRGINDVITFNFAPIIMRMQDTIFPIYAMNSKGKIKTINSEKTYPINIVQAISLDKETHYQHYTVNIAKSGIKKLLVIKK